MKDNIVMEKIWQESDLLELRITCGSEYITANQTCYIQSSALETIHGQIAEYVENPHQSRSVEFGDKHGNHTPAFSMDILEISASGHVKIEVDMEIEDNDTRKHRCLFYVKSELGMLERFGKRLKKLIHGDIGSQVILNEVG